MILSSKGCRRAAVEGQASDPYWSDTILCTQFNGDVGTLDFSDQSWSGVPMYAEPASPTYLEHVDDYYYFYSSSMRIRSGDRIRAAMQDAIGVGDFTVECMIRIADVTGPGLILSMGPVSLCVVNNKVGVGVTAEGGITINVNTWHYVTFIRNSSYIRVFVDNFGEAAPVYNVASIAAQDFYIGATSSRIWPLNAHLDSIRITKVARPRAYELLAPFPNG